MKAKRTFASERRVRESLSRVVPLYHYRQRVTERQMKPHPYTAEYHGICPMSSCMASGMSSIFRLAKYGKDAYMEVEVQIILSKVATKRKTKMEVRIPFSKVVGKRETTMEVLIPFSKVIGKRKTTMEVLITFSKVIGKRLDAFIVITRRVS